MDIDKLKKEYEFAKEGKDLPGERVARRFSFVKMLLSDNSLDVVTMGRSNLMAESIQPLLIWLGSRSPLKPVPMISTCWMMTAALLSGIKGFTAKKRRPCTGSNILS